jgi:hypothetical protein
VIAELVVRVMMYAIGGVLAVLLAALFLVFVVAALRPDRDRRVLLP